MTNNNDIDLLRQAAAKIRETAAAMTAPEEMRGMLGGPWGEHAALWSPPVALAVADWLDGEASLLGECEPFVAVINAVISNDSGIIGELKLGKNSDTGEVAMRLESTPAALRLARLILGA